PWVVRGQGAGVAAPWGARAGGGRGGRAAPPAAPAAALGAPAAGGVPPADVTQALAAGARAGGATVRENVTVSRVRVDGGAVAGVETSDGPMACETVVNCGGMWARALGQRNGVVVPGGPVEHF